MINRIDMIKYLIKKGVNNWNHAINCAAFGGHFVIVKYLLCKVTNNKWDDVLYYADMGGHLDIVKFIIS